MRRPAAIVTAAGVLVVLLTVAVPFLAEDRVLPAAVPQPPPLTEVALVPVAPGARACLTPVAIDEHSDVARIRAATRGRRGEPLTLTLSGRGYEASAREPGGYADGAVLAIDVRAPERATTVRACVRNDGDRRLELYAAGDRARGPAEATSGGQPAPASFELAFQERRPASFAARAAAMAERATRFRPGGAWLAWLLAALVLLGVPAALTWAVAAAAPRERGGGGR